MAILERETGGKSYKSFKYSLDESDRSAVEYGEVEKTMQWARRGETKLFTSSIDLTSLSKEIARSDGQLLSYFLDGSRHVYKVDDMGFEKSGNRTAIYPIIAGQIGVGCCRRVDKQMSVEDMAEKLSLPCRILLNQAEKNKAFSPRLLKNSTLGQSFAA